MFRHRPRPPERPTALRLSHQSPLHGKPSSQRWSPKKLKKVTSASVILGTLALISLPFMVSLFQEDNLANFGQDEPVLSSSSTLPNKFPTRALSTLNSSSAVQSASVACPHPCMVEYNFEANSVVQLKGRWDYEGDPSEDGPAKFRGDSSEVEDEGECHYINPQHNLQFPTCATLHETDLYSVTFIHCGGARCAFFLPDSSDSSQKIVLKVHKWKKKKKFQERHWVKARLDGLIMEQASSSSFVIDLYGMCGTSQLLPYAPRGALFDHIKLARKAEQDALEAVDKLKIMVHVASAVADLHSVSVVHGDIWCQQFLWKDGVYKLNDFHMSTFLKQDSNQQLCWGQNQLANHEMLGRAPEEVQRRDLDQRKVDVFMMGSTMYNVYTKNWLYEGIPEEEALQMFHGNHSVSSFPAHLDTTIPANAAMQSAIQQCWSYDPQERPTASKVRDFLRGELAKILDVPSVTKEMLRVDVPALPKGHRYTSTSMDGTNDKRKPKKHIRYRENNSNDKQMG